MKKTGCITNDFCRFNSPSGNQIGMVETIGLRSTRLRMREEHVVAAREDLLTHDLVAYQHPLTQVLSLPPARVSRGLHGLGELVRSLKNVE